MMSNHVCHNRECYKHMGRNEMTTRGTQTDKAEREPESSSEHTISPVLNKQQEGDSLHPETCHSTTRLTFTNSVF